MSRRRPAAHNSSPCSPGEAGPSPALTRNRSPPLTGGEPEHLLRGDRPPRCRGTQGGLPAGSLVCSGKGTLIGAARAAAPSALLGSPPLAVAAGRARRPGGQAATPGRQPPPGWLATQLERPRRSASTPTAAVHVHRPRPHPRLLLRLRAASTCGRAAHGDPRRSSPGSERVRRRYLGGNDIRRRARQAADRRRAAAIEPSTRRRRPGRAASRTGRHRRSRGRAAPRTTGRRPTTPTPSGRPSWCGRALAGAEQHARGRGDGLPAGPAVRRRLLPRVHGRRPTAPATAAPSVRAARASTPPPRRHRPDGHCERPAASAAWPRSLAERAGWLVAAPGRQRLLRRRGIATRTPPVSPRGARRRSVATRGRQGAPAGSHGLRVTTKSPTRRARAGRRRRDRLRRAPTSPRQAREHHRGRPYYWHAPPRRRSALAEPDALMPLRSLRARARDRWSRPGGRRLAAAPGRWRAGSGGRRRQPVRSPGTGVTVVVDYGTLGGGVEIGLRADSGGQAAASAMVAAGVG